MRLKHFVCLFLSIFMAFTFSMNPLTTFAAYESDDDVFDFLAEFTAQRNAAQAIKNAYDEYKNSVLSVDTAFNLAVQSVKNVKTDVSALANSIKKYI